MAPASRLGTAVLSVILLLPAAAFAQSPREQFRVGVYVSLIAWAKPASEVAFRVNLPMGEKTGFDLGLGQLGPMKLETPVPVSMTMHVDFCIDGKQPDGIVQVGGRSKARLRPFCRPGRSISIST